ncbi:PREDICTED: uncharacterized protein C9orf50 homolog [Dipodomys ordii]|uniref:Uncharacterized protein C9orf50 homolog n=1 Tax=Dipodomys ordii TaxID=10020 RepID=A0A1S3FJN1_DIPOR|nr:PREDICTED: uncharacterized protein C9orf50 homolog [Dipodomys ordii]
MQPGGAAIQNPNSREHPKEKGQPPSKSAPQSRCRGSSKLTSGTQHRALWPAWRLRAPALTRRSPGDTQKTYRKASHGPGGRAGAGARRSADLGLKGARRQLCGRSRRGGQARSKSDLPNGAPGARVRSTLFDMSRIAHSAHEGARVRSALLRMSTRGLQGSQVPRISTVQIPNPGEGTAPRHRRYCPFRVRFEDETLRDSERRYWERNCAVHRNIFEDEPSTLPEGSVPERVLRNVGKWLESLPKAVYPRLKEAMGSSSSSWERTGVASTSRPRGDYKTFLDAYGTLGRRSPAPCSCTHKQEPFLPSLVLQSLLRRGRL